MAPTDERSKRSSDAALRTLREEALAKYPGAHLKSPWPGHLDLAVNDKTFAHLSVEGEPFSISCKLPSSADVALQLPFASPTGYGLGKSGWVTAKIPEGEPIPLDLFRAWIDESYRARAPKKLVAALDGTAPKGAPAAAATKRRASEKAATEKPVAAKKPAGTAKAAGAAKTARTAKPAGAAKTAGTAKPPATATRASTAKKGR